MLSLLVAATLTPTAPNSAQFAAWGAEALGKIRTELYLPATHLYAESRTGNAVSGTAFNWSAGVTLSALDAAAEYDPKYKPLLKEYADAIEQYWNAEPPVAGFDVSPGSEAKDRYYDDNEWMAIALADAHRILGDIKYLGSAEGAMDFALSGEDSSLGGGIFWRENDKSSKNACSNAPAVVGLSALFRLTQKREYLDRAEAIYKWTHLKLRDPETSLYWDHVKKDGTIEKTFWSYNTAMVIKAGSQLYQLTGNEAYAEQARQAETASVGHWVNAAGAIADEGKFAHMLVEAWLMRFALAARRQENFGATERALKALEYLHAKVRDPKGHYPARWDRAGARLDKWTLIDQASAARAFFVAANFLRARSTGFSPRPVG